MTEAKNISIDVRKLFNLGANLLIAGFINQKPDDAKKLFKDLKQGKSVVSGQLSAKETDIKLPIKLEMDRSEYRGQFNYPNFETALKSLLNQFQIKVRQDPELETLGVRTNQETGGILFSIAGATQIGDDVNVLMMGVEPGESEVLVRLLFMDPEQFKSSSATP